MALRQREYSGRIASLPLSGFFPCIFLFLHLIHMSHCWTDFDGLYVIWRLFAQGCAFRGSHWYHSPFRGRIPKTPKRGLNRRYPDKPTKIINALSPQLFKISRWNFARWCTAPVCTLLKVEKLIFKKIILPYLLQSFKLSQWNFARWRMA